MKDENKLIGIIALSSLKGIGAAFIKKAITNKSFGTSNHLNEIKEITEANNKKFDDDTIFLSIENARDILFKCIEENISIIALTDSSYPNSLKELKDPPSLIYCKGNLELLYPKIICIIGTREPNENGTIIAERIGAYFTSSNWAICNGLADGIDSFAIKSNGQVHNKVIGVLAGGLNYNSKKTLLRRTAENAEKVLENGGLLISEIFPDKKEDTFTVVKSCRIQAGIAHGLILIQSSLDGGSRFTVKSFCETRRPIGVINPVPSDFELTMYGANKELLVNSKKGLSKFVELKEDKIQTNTIFAIKSKDDYKEFENIIIDSQENKEQASTNLFG
jgi:DNA processing protein